VLLAVFTRSWFAVINNLNFFRVVVRVVLLIMLGVVISVSAGPNVSSNVAWLLLLFVLATETPRPLTCVLATQADAKHRAHWRFVGQGMSIKPWRGGIFLVGVLGALFTLANIFELVSSPQGNAALNGLMLCAVWAELSLLGGIFDTTDSRRETYGRTVIAAWVLVQFGPADYSLVLLYGCMAFLLISSAGEELGAPRNGSE